MIVVHMGDDDVFHVRRVHADGSQRVGGRPKKISSALFCRRFVEASIQHDHTAAGLERPHEIIDRHGAVVVRISADEVLTRHAMVMRIAQRVNFPNSLGFGHIGYLNTNDAWSDFSLCLVIDAEGLFAIKIL